ncbi:hypothetical protein JKP88DRAFT_268932 [Tribonema minus]|uniref:EF-hand domain-containing protein n=1 Tax=Tribonema minus TaxID=303371 RepID=A0A836CPR7_9STRA|nr:hypothetical protein JKP88DRAFT_268932 [Tribonema minus]
MARTAVLVLSSCVLLLALAVVRSQWDGGMDPREEEYFAARMRQPQRQGGLYQEPQRKQSMLPLVGGLVGGWLLDMQLTRKADRKRKLSHEHDKKALAQRLQKHRNAEVNKKLVNLANLEALVEDAELRIEELQQAAVDAGMDISATQAEVDYEEFKQPDANHDNRISRAEFNAYIADYLRQYPHLRREDMPKFEDFDSSRDGSVNFKEWQMYLERQRKEDAAIAAAEAAKKQAAAGGGAAANQYRRA